MNIQIFYFSAEGNSLAVAKEVALGLGKGELISLSKNRNSIAPIEADVVGFIFPVYFQSIPRLVKQTVKKMRFTGKPYIFSIATNNGVPGKANRHLDQFLRKRGQKVSIGFDLKMPGTSVLLYNFTSTPEEESARLKEAKDSLPEIIDSIRQRKVRKIEGKQTLANKLFRLAGSVVFQFYKVPQHFTADEQCNRCGICARVCPENNISASENRILWGKNCSNCLACYHWCPQKAVQLDEYTGEWRQYHHPDISLKEMLLR